MKRTTAVTLTIDFTDDQIAQIAPELKAQRDDLLAACKAMLSTIDDDSAGPICPLCHKENTLFNDDGYTDEAPRSYHAECWRIVSDARAAVAKAEGKEQQ